MQWMVIFLGLGLDAVDGHNSGVRSGCSKWSYFWSHNIRLKCKLCENHNYSSCDKFHYSEQNEYFDNISQSSLAMIVNIVRYN